MSSPSVVPWVQFLSICGPVKLKRQAIFSPHTQHTVVSQTLDNHYIPSCTKREEWRHGSHWSVASPKSSKCWSFFDQISKCGTNSTWFLVPPLLLLVLPSESSFFMKARMCLQLSSFSACFLPVEFWGSSGLFSFCTVSHSVQAGNIFVDVIPSKILWASCESHWDSLH